MLRPASGIFPLRGNHPPAILEPEDPADDRIGCRFARSNAPASAGSLHSAPLMSRFASGEALTPRVARGGETPSEPHFSRLGRSPALPIPLKTEALLLRAHDPS